MKTLIAAALLLTLASPASAGGSDAKWDCGQGITALAGKGEFGFHMGKAYKEDGYPVRGTVKWDLRGHKNRNRNLAERQGMQADQLTSTVLPAFVSDSSC